MIAPMAPAAAELLRLLGIMARLRDPVAGCAWDRAQDFRSLAPYALEEAYELVDAIERNAPAQHLRDELGDVLLQVVFHAQIAREQGLFDFTAVAGACADKLTRRHPQVFGPDTDRAAQGPAPDWDSLKAAECAHEADPSALAGVPVNLPAAVRAQKLQRRAARVGFDWDALSGVLAKLEEELAELRAALNENPARIADEIGDLLFTCVNLARHAQVDAETALRGANRKFERRFRALEAELAARDQTVAGADAATLDALWCAAKVTESGTAAAD